MNVFLIKLAQFRLQKYGSMVFGGMPKMMILTIAILIFCCCLIRQRTSRLGGCSWWCACFRSVERLGLHLWSAASAARMGVKSLCGLAKWMSRKCHSSRKSLISNPADCSNIAGNSGLGGFASLLGKWLRQKDFAASGLCWSSCFWRSSRGALFYYLCRVLQGPQLWSFTCSWPCCTKTHSRSSWKSLPPCHWDWCSLLPSSSSLAKTSRYGIGRGR